MHLCISREAMCGALSIHVAVVPRGIRGNLVPRHWEIPTAQGGRKARHVRLRLGGTDTSQQEGVVCGVLSGIGMERRIPRLLQWIPWKATAGAVHHRGSRWRWGSFGRESSRIHGSRMRFHFDSHKEVISPKATKHWGFHTFRFPSNVQFAMFMISVHRVHSSSPTVQGKRSAAKLWPNAKAGQRR